MRTTHEYFGRLKFQSLKNLDGFISVPFFCLKLKSSKFFGSSRPSCNRTQYIDFDWLTADRVHFPDTGDIFFLVAMATVQDKLMQKVGEEWSRTHTKVTIVGVGQVGMACAYSIMQQVISAKHQAHSQGLSFPSPEGGKNRHWKRGCQNTSFLSVSFLSSFSPSSLLSIFPLCLSFLPSFVSCF